MVCTVSDFSPQDGDPRRSLGLRVEARACVLGEVDDDGFGRTKLDAFVIRMVFPAEDNLLNDASRAVHLAMLPCQVLDEDDACSSNNLTL